jgi:hypothetical protein
MKQNIKDFILNSKIFETFLIILVFIFRLHPHMANFSPVLAVWAYQGNKKINPWFLAIVLLATDIILGLSPILLWVWLSYGLIWLISKRLSWWKRSIASTFLFFVITNFGVYAAGWYDNIWTCYFMALPFFINSLIATIGFSGLIYLLEKVGLMQAIPIKKASFSYVG